MSAKIIIWSW